MTIPGQAAVTRFLENEQRLDDFVNVDGTYTSRFGNVVETLPSLSRTVATLTLSIVDKSNWVTATAYNRNDLVKQNNINYLCIIAHTSGTFATDLAANKWVVYLNLLTTDLANTSNVALGDKLIGSKNSRTGGKAKTQHDRNEEWVHVMDFDGVTGNDSGGAGADDTVGIQAALTAMAGGKIDFSGFSYKITDELTVPANTSISGFSGTIRQATANKGVLKTVSGGIVIHGLKLKGSQYVADHAGEDGFRAIGTSAASPAVGIKLINCDFDTFGANCVSLKWVEDFSVINCTLKNIYYAGVLTQSCKYGRIADNYIKNLVGTPNAYGIACTRATVDSLTTDPRSSYITVSGNVVNGNTNWVAYDTHGGESIVFSSNTAIGCKYGLNLTYADGATTKFAPLNCRAIGNTLDSGVTDGSAVYGIIIAGAIGIDGTPIEKAKGLVVSGNTLKGYGTQNSATLAAIRVSDTDGLVIDGNTIREASPAAIYMLHDNYNFSITNNVIVDTWSSSLNAFGIEVNGPYNTGYIGGNTICADSKSATYVNTNGIYISNSTGNDIKVGINRVTSTTKFSDSGLIAKAELLAPTQIQSQFTPVFANAATSYTLTKDVQILFCNATSGNQTVTLPVGSTFPTGTSPILYIFRKDSSGNTLTIAAGAGNTINGGASITLTASTGCVILIWDPVGTNWRSIAKV